MDFTILALVLCIFYPIRYFLDFFKVRLSSKAMQYVSLFLSGSLLALFSLFLAPLLPKVLCDVVSIGISFVKSLQFLMKDMRQLIVK